MIELCCCILPFHILAPTLCVYELLVERLQSPMPEAVPPAHDIASIRRPHKPVEGTVGTPLERLREDTRKNARNFMRQMLHSPSPRARQHILYPTTERVIRLHQ